MSPYGVTKPHWVKTVFNVWTHLYGIGNQTVWFTVRRFYVAEKLDRCGFARYQTNTWTNADLSSVGANVAVIEETAFEYIVCTMCAILLRPHVQHIRVAKNNVCETVSLKTNVMQWNNSLCGLWPYSQLTYFTNPRMRLFHIPQCSSQTRNVHISILKRALWDLGLVHFCDFWNWSILWSFVCMYSQF